MNPTDRAIAEWGCLRLCHLWAHYADRGDFPAVAALFTPDGIFVRDGEPLRGHEAIAQAYAHRPRVTVLHIVTNFLAHEVSVSRAVASLYMMPVSTFDTSKVPKLDPMASFRLLRFEDQYQLTPDGWRFAKRVATPVMMSPQWPGQPVPKA
jgi:SnoaL-like domain